MNIAQLAWCVAIWIALGVWIGRSVWSSRRSVGLVVSYLVNLALIHWIAAAIFLLPWARLWTGYLVIDGFWASTVGIIGAAIGITMVAPFIDRHFVKPTQQVAPVAVSPRMALMYVLVGMFSYALLGTSFGLLPSVTAVISSGVNLVVVGLCLLSWQAWRSADRGKFVLSLIVIALLPIATILRQGFLAFGSIAALAVLTFIAAFYRPRWRVIVFAPVIAYIALSVFETYMRDRTEIRSQVWGGASYAARAEQLFWTFRDFEWFSLTNEDQLARIDQRLNQNFLVGAAMQYINGGARDFARGETIRQAFMALIPRAIWLSKPVFAGSGTLVSDYTGIYFDITTSVGVGQVMELYINFGLPGVFWGFLILGTCVALVDRRAADYLRQGNWPRFALWFLPGIALLDVGGVLAEVTAAAAGSIILVQFANKMLLRNFWRMAPEVVSHPALPFAAAGNPRSH